MNAGLARALERFLLPNACLVCERLVEQHRPDALICGVCSARLRPIVPGCRRCGQPLPPVGPCRFCAGWPENLSFARSAVWLADAARTIIHRLKYDGWHGLGTELGGIVARHVPRPARAYLVPVPLSQRRLRDRGYNQATVLARGIAAVWQYPVAERLLHRVRETQTQTALTPEERADNVAGAFEAAPRSAGGRAIILIDDVLTTGATLCAAACALAAAGWLTIGAVTLARALPYDIRVAGGTSRTPHDNSDRG